MKVKHTMVLALAITVLISGCTATQTQRTQTAEAHVTDDMVDECFGHHADDAHDEALKHCQEELCGTDSHCMQEVEEMAEHHR